MLFRSGILADKSFLLTGKLDGMSRAEAKSLIEQNSGSIISNVSKKLDYLIIGEKPTKRKVDAAKELKIKILDQKDFLKILNKNRPLLHNFFDRYTDRLKQIFFQYFLQFL